MSNSALREAQSQLKKWRQENMISQAQLAKKLWLKGVNRNWISHLEKCTTINTVTPDRVARIKKITGVDFSICLDTSDRKSHAKKDLPKQETLPTIDELEQKRETLARQIVAAIESIKEKRDAFRRKTLEAGISSMQATLNRLQKEEQFISAYQQEVC